MSGIRLRLATASAAVAAVLQATMPTRVAARRERIYAVRVAEAEPRVPVFITRLRPHALRRSPW
ncbi:MAG TPA: hypothetical protein VM573_02825 [Actinomycetota bacterium]|nr:hypothetical protein [Actinomycetota bacterium]